MTDGYPVCRLGAVASVQGGFAFKSSDFIETGVPVLKIKNVRLREVDTTEPAYVDQSVAKDTARYFCKTGDLLISMTGSGPQAPNSVVGRVARFTGPSDKYLINQRVGRFVNKAPDKLDQRYLFYVLAQDETLWKLVSVATGSANQANISGSQIESLEIPLPPLAEQKAIAAVLGALDDKIELNRRINATLEAMARALFQSWFVDFDPVRLRLSYGGQVRATKDHPAGLPAEALAKAGLDPATAALFPDSFQDSPVGHIPKGWEVKTADEISVVGIGKTPPRKEHHWFSENPADVPWMSIRDLGEAGVFISKTSEFLTPEAVEKFRVRRIPDDTVVLSFKLTMGRVAITDGEMLSNEAIAHFRLNPETPFGSAYLYCYLKGFGYDQLGSTSSIATAINSDMVRGIKVLVPSKGVAAAFEATVAPLFAQMKTIQNQSRTLATLRDTLLPKLLSGELTIQAP